MTAPAPRDRREGGFLIYVIVVFIALSAALSISVRGTFQALLKDRPRERAAFAAVYAAQGGVEKARAALARDASYAGGIVEVGRGSAAVTVRPVAGEDSLRDVVSIGSIPGPGVATTAARLRIDARVRLGPGLPRVVSWREGR